MTTEQKAKAYDEALEIAKNVLETDLHESGVWAIKKIFHELKESEDERIRKKLIEIIGYFRSRGIDQHLCEEFLAYLEKQKEASKAIEAVEKIDKYIDEHLANAHDMKDSVPDKKYYRGWDDALGKMAGILQDVYSEEKKKDNKFTPRVLPCSAAWFEDGEEKQKEQKPAEWSEDDKENLGLVIECIYKYYPEPVMKYKLKDWLKSLRPQPHWKPSEEQMKVLLNAEGLLRKYRHIAIASKLAELYEELKKPGVKEEPEYYQHFDPDC